MLVQCFDHNLATFIWQQVLDVTVWNGWKPRPDSRPVLDEYVDSLALAQRASFAQSLIDMIDHRPTLVLLVCA